MHRTCSFIRGPRLGPRVIKSGPSPLNATIDPPS